MPNKAFSTNFVDTEKSRKIFAKNFGQIEKELIDLIEKAFFSLEDRIKVEKIVSRDIDRLIIRGENIIRQYNQSEVPIRYFLGVENTIFQMIQAGQLLKNSVQANFGNTKIAPKRYNEQIIEIIKENEDIFFQATETSKKVSKSAFNEVMNLKQRTVNGIITQDQSLTLKQRNKALEIGREAAIKGLREGKGTLQIVNNATKEMKKIVNNKVYMFTDRGGRRWGYERYAELISRDIIGESHRLGEISQYTTLGVDLVKVSEHSGSCPFCAPYQNTVISINGSSPGFPTYSQLRGESGHIFKFGCRHTFVPLEPNERKIIAKPNF